MEKIRIEWIGELDGKEVRRMGYECNIGSDFMFTSKVFEALTNAMNLSASVSKGAGGSEAKGKRHD